VTGTGPPEAFLAYADPGGVVHWSDELEGLHEESSRTHFIDVWTRRAMLARLGRLPPGALVADIGCSTGYLLENLRAAHPDAELLGIDLVGAGLRKAHALVPDARLLLADACALPLRDGSLDAALSANLLEHIPDDEAALRELARVLRPGGRAVLVVPAAPGSYDYYDRFLGHQRRYAGGELAARARHAGLLVLEDIHLGSLLFPAFWLVKQRNRRRFGDLAGDALAARVSANIASTRDSVVGRLACRLEERLLGLGVRIPAGIRSLTVVQRPSGPS